MHETPDIRAALSSEVLRVFVRGWCRGNQRFAKVVVYWLIASMEDLPRSTRTIAAVTGVKESQTRYIIAKFRRAIAAAQIEEQMLGLPKSAWARRQHKDDDER